jgi:hypothetical protein
MTEHADKVEKRRFQLFKEKTDLPTLETRADWDYMLKHYPSGKTVKVYDDKRRKEETLEDKYQAITNDNADYFIQGEEDERNN